MKPIKYSKINAMAYQATDFLCFLNKKFSFNPWILKIRYHCFEDWIEYKAQMTLKSLNIQTEQLHEYWTTTEAKDLEPLFYEFDFDEDSKDTPLGPTMGSTYSFCEDEPETSSSPERN
jgi:hypothetical protein